MRFQVPQFIEVESKIFGPLSLTQFIYLAGGAGLVFLIYRLGGWFLAILVGFPVGGFMLALAFYKHGGYQPFMKLVENFFKYFGSSKLYIWKKEKLKKKELEEAKEISEHGEIYVPKLTKSRLNDLAWSLDIKKGVRDDE